MDETTFHTKSEDIQIKGKTMVQDKTVLPEGAGATSSTDARDRDTRTALTHSSSERSSGDSVGHRELVMAKQHGGPSTATVIGAAIAGAVAGAAIPFMLSAGSAGRRSSSARDSRTETPVTESVIVNRPARELYDFWREFTNLPQFMDNVKSVEKLDEKRSHWVIKAPAGTSVEFDSRVVDDVPGRMISWQSEPGARVPNRGRVEFIETSSGEGTNVRVTISYDPPAGAAGRLIAKVLRREPALQAREDLQRLKRLMETDRPD
jgi:uncharacterized membrane protein